MPYEKPIHSPFIIFELLNPCTIQVFNSRPTSSGLDLQ